MLQWLEGRVPLRVRCYGRCSSTGHRRRVASCAPDDGFRYELVLGNYAGGDIVPDLRLAVWEVLS